MGKHVEERLAERVVPADAEVAFELLRDPRALARFLAWWLPQQPRPDAERVALPLEARPPTAHLLVTRDGHGVTCLAPGMTFDVPAIPHGAVRAFLEQQRVQLRVGLAAHRLDEGGGRGAGAVPSLVPRLPDDPRGV